MASVARWMLSWHHLLCLAQAQMDRLDSILTGIPPERVKQLQLGLGRVWQRFFYRDYSLFAPLLAQTRTRHVEDYVTEWRADASLPSTKIDLSTEDDAFATIIHWLYSKRLKQKPANDRLQDGKMHKQ